MMRAGLTRMLCLVAIIIAGCGGGSDESTDAKALRARAPLAAAALTPDALMDWAQGRYPQLFPGPAQDRQFDIYTYRAYPGHNYIGVGSDGKVYVWSPVLFGGSLTSVGTLASFACTVDPLNCASTVSGTAATGGPIAGLTITLKDSASNTVTATTSATGTYSFSTSGLTAPFVLQVTPAGGAPLFGVSVDTGTSVIANVTPFTDLIVRSWYGVQGKSAGSAFADLAANPPPSQLQARAVAQAVLAMAKLSFVVSGAGITQALDMINRPFNADHSGIDAVFDATTISYTASGASVAIAGAGLQQNTALSFDTGHGSMTAVTVTGSAAGSSGSSRTSVIPVTPTQLAAWTGIEAQLSAFTAVVNEKGAALAASDLLPYLDPSLLNDGLNRDQFAANVAQSLSQGQSLSLELQTIASLDLAGGRAESVSSATQSYQGQTERQPLDFFFRQVNGSWLLSGNQRIAELSVYAEARMNQGAYAQGNGPSVNFDTRPLKDSVLGVTFVSSTGTTYTATRGATSVDDSGLLLDAFFANTGPLSPSAIPPAGTLYTVNYARASGGTLSVPVAINALTTEPAPITSPTGSTLADAHLGGQVGVSWQLPTTYAIARVNLGALYYTSTSQSDPATYQCETSHPVLGTTAAAGTLSIPTTCNGLPVKSVSINLSITGYNGERSQTIYTLQ